MAQRYAHMPGTSISTNETKPRLGKDEVAILEREFDKNSKPTTQKKRQFAADMGVELARINNWFQNRRAKRKQERKQKAYEAGSSEDNSEQNARQSSRDFTYSNEYTSVNNTIPLAHSLAPLHFSNNPSHRDSDYDFQYAEHVPTSMKSLRGTAIPQVAEEKHFRLSSSKTHDLASQSVEVPSQKSEDSSDSNPVMNTKYEVSDHEWRILKNIPPPMDIASRRRRTKSAISGNADRADKLVLKSPQPTPIRTKLFDKREKDFDIKYPPSLTAGPSLKSVISPPSPISPRIIETSLLKVANTCWSEFSFDESVGAWHFQVVDEGHHSRVKDHLKQKLELLQKVSLRASSPPVTYQFSHTNPSDFLEYNHRENNSVHDSFLSNKSSDIQEAKLLEDRVKAVTPIKEESLCMPAAVGGKRFVNNTSDSPVAIISEEVIGNVERNCHSETDEQDEDELPDDHNPSDKTAIPRRVRGTSWGGDSDLALTQHCDEPNGVIWPILNPMRQDLVERIMDEFWIMFDQHWAVRMTQCPESSSPSDKSSYQGSQANKVSSITPKQKRQRSKDEDSPDDNGNKKPRKQSGGLPFCSKFNDRARFACPFRKHNPQRYGIHSHRVCTLTGWETIARVKEHLYRSHKASLYCKRCWKIFENEELLDSHTIVPAALICEAIPGNPPEGITPKQIAELKSKAKPYANQKDTDRWKEIFRLLFPGESVPSPYWEPVQEYMPTSPNSLLLASYDDYMHRELPRLFRSRVEEVVHQEMQPVEAALLANLEGLIRECQAQLSSGYRETSLSMTTKQPEVSSVSLGQSTEATSAPNAADDQSTTSSEKEQEHSSDFFDSVLQPPTPQEEDYFVNISAADIRLLSSHNHTLSSSLSDSGYVSVQRCDCEDFCSCLSSMIDFDNPAAGISEPCSVDHPQHLEEQNGGVEGVEWQDWVVN